MMRTNALRVLAIVVAVCAVGTVLSADLRKSTENSESRRRASETGVKQIRVKGAAGLDAIQAAYAEAVSQHNAWLDAVLQSIQQPSATAPDVAAMADRAANGLVAFVALRNRALGELELAGVAAESVRKVVIRDLTDIANEFWRNNRTRDAKRREVATQTLGNRLRWKTWDQVQ